jgi:hypothetical protein
MSPLEYSQNPLLPEAPNITKESGVPSKKKKKKKKKKATNLKNTLSPQDLSFEPYSASPNLQLRSSGQMGTAEQQENLLQNARERLLGTRFRLKDQREELRDLRQKTGLAEGAVINQLRIVFQDRNLDFPVELEIAFARALTLRESLGSLEGTYEEEEEKYDDLEWNYTQKEESYLTKVTSHNGNAMDAANTAESDDATLYAPVTRESDMSTRGFPDLRPDEFMKPLRISEAALQMFEQHSSCNIPQASRSNFKYHQPGEGTDIYSSLPQMSNETAISQAELDWNKVKSRVDTWILDNVSCSQYQRLVLRSLFSKDDIDDATWWDLVRQHWNSDSPCTPPIGMNAADSLHTLRDTPHSLVVATPIITPRSKVDIECHEVEEEPQECLVLDNEQNACGQSIARSSPEASSNQQGHKPQTCNMKDAGLQIMVPSKPQESRKMLHRYEGGAKVVASLERLPVKSQTTNPKLGDFRSNTQKQITYTNQHLFPILVENNTKKITIGDVSSHRYRRWSNPELRSHSHETLQPNHHENTAAEFRPYSPHFDPTDNATRKGAFLTPRGYGRTTIPPKTRSRSCTGSLSVQNRSLQALEHIGHDADLQPSSTALKDAFPESAHIFRPKPVTAYELQAQSSSVMCPVPGFTNFRSLEVLMPTL